MVEDGSRPGFFADHPVDQHLTVFRQLRTDIGVNTIEHVGRMNPEEFALRLQSAKDGAFYRVMLQLRPNDALISGLEVEKE